MSTTADDYSTRDPQADPSGLPEDDRTGGLVQFAEQQPLAFLAAAAAAGFMARGVLRTLLRLRRAKKEAR